MDWKILPPLAQSVGGWGLLVDEVVDEAEVEAGVLIMVEQGVGVV